jgi:hypothetical protein
MFAIALVLLRGLKGPVKLPIACHRLADVLRTLVVIARHVRQLSAAEVESAPMQVRAAPGVQLDHTKELLYSL